ncbi:hypothetical protein SLS60_007978 [Paraconiothyrium brasiliense]|uniref:Uncharacterized protein n=1 Tax=Paraconiothyrium brasiliense TaxID=300254 RepID=A0ABR3R329_9PLEO
MTGNYTRTHDSPSSNSDLSKYSLPTRTSDMTSPVDPDLIQFSELQRVVRTPELREGYIDEKGKLVGRHVNKEDPAEMTDTSVQGGRLF